MQQYFMYNTMRKELTKQVCFTQSLANFWGMSEAMAMAPGQSENQAPEMFIVTRVKDVSIV